MQHSLSYRIFVAVAVVLCVSLIDFLRENSQRKKLLQQCEADSTCTNTFVFKGKTYSKDKYITIKSADYKNIKPATLDKMIKSNLKMFEKGKLTDLQILDLEAMQLAKNNK